ncbi:hotdog family protein [Williamsia deligens]|uniref:MaoC/PaaZ C-terminal domain-containing protein n=1 Tax=Williamsia deligens TaxID=321325 RepID=A0ABW3G6V5_9NOCA|nr:MaoC/PaaZ C-terminal domain-containing protein [Williamsia deligens]MCP2193006.1 MaoC like domain-containing protein [Williamsia deligens]
MTVSTAPPAATVGIGLPELRIEATPTFIVSSALATRDFQDVHHDRDLAHAKGSKDIFVNILTDTGLVGRFVTDWAGQRARIRSITLRLGVPWYAYDTLALTGTVTALDAGVATVDVVGTNSLGKHVVSTVSVVLDHTVSDSSASESSVGGDR